MSEMCRVDQTIGAPSIIPGVSQQIAIGASSQQSTAFQIHNILGKATTWIKVYATSDCFLQMGTSPVALADGTSMFHNNGLTDYYGIPPGATHLAVIQLAASGTLYLTEGL